MRQRQFFELIFEFDVPTYPYNALNLHGFDATQRTRSPTSVDRADCPDDCENSYTIFEGTSEVQRLVIARAISGLHIN